MSAEMLFAVGSLLVALWAWGRVEVEIWRDRRAVKSMAFLMDEELARIEPPADYRRFGCPDCPDCQKMRDRAAKNLGGRL